MKQFTVASLVVWCLFAASLPADESTSAVAVEAAEVELIQSAKVSAPAIARRDQPVKINHPKGVAVQALYVDSAGEWSFLDDAHFVRSETFTILAAPPSTYLVTTGDSTILKIVGDSQPQPRPRPNPNPRPQPEPSPQPEPNPEPGPVPIVAEWAIWIEEQSDRSQHVEETAVIMDAEARRSLSDRGLKVRVYDDDQPEARWLVDAAGAKRPAFLLLEEGSPPRVFPAPKSAEQLETIVRENVVR